MHELSWVLRLLDRRSYIIFFTYLACLVLLALSACSAGQAQEVDVRYAGGRDVLSLVRTVEKDFFAESSYTVGETPSKNRLKDLKSGKLDLLVLGREPTKDELIGLKDTVVAYDAIVPVVSTRTYGGGEYRIPQGNSNVILKDKRFDGLTEVSMSDLEALYRFRLGLETKSWYPKEPLYQFIPSRGAEGVEVPLTTSTPPEVQGSWAVGQATTPGYLYKPGEYDLQTELLNRLGLPEPVPNENLSFMLSHLESEEELLAQMFKIDPDLATPNSDRYSFDLLLQPFSRNVVVRALEHGFAIRSLKVDGIDPIDDPSSIYKGAYPLSRRIHVLTADPAPEAAAALVNYLLSTEGQKKLAEIEFLPLP
jgi:hypothetical protein